MMLFDNIKSDIDSISIEINKISEADLYDSMGRIPLIVAIAKKVKVEDFKTKLMDVFDNKLKV